MARKKGVVLLSDVAKYAKVSVATASAVLNNRTGPNIRVSTETQTRVFEAARILNYIPNIAARSLSGGKNEIITIFTYESIFPYEQRNFYFPFLLGIESEAERLGFDLLLITGARIENGRRHIFENGINRLKIADGAIVIGLQRNEEELSRLIREDFPVVFIGHRELPGVETSYVAADYTAATAQIVGHLLENGHRRIVYLGVAGGGEPGRERRIGYEQAMLEQNLMDASFINILDSLKQVSGELLLSYLDRGVTALVCEDYIVCGRVVHAAELSGIKIPDDLSIAVLSGPSESVLGNYDWTSFLIPDIEMGKTAVSFLSQMIDSENRIALRSLLPCEIHLGHTVKRINSE